MKFWQKAWLEWRNFMFKVFSSFALSMIYFYQLFLRSWLGTTCRFTPTCSQYAVEAFKQQPPHQALLLVLRRLGRCHPWGPFGLDPVPPVLKENSQP